MELQRTVGILVPTSIVGIGWGAALIAAGAGAQETVIAAAHGYIHERHLKTAVAWLIDTLIPVGGFAIGVTRAPLLGHGAG